MSGIINDSLSIDKSAIQSITIYSKAPEDESDEYDVSVRIKVKKADVDVLLKEYDNLVDFDDDVTV